MIRPTCAGSPCSPAPATTGRRLLFVAASARRTSRARRSLAANATIGTSARDIKRRGAPGCRAGSRRRREQRRFRWRPPNGSARTVAVGPGVRCRRIRGTSAAPPRMSPLLGGARRSAWPTDPVQSRVGPTAPAGPARHPGHSGGASASTQGSLRGTAVGVPARAGELQALTGVAGSHARKRRRTRTRDAALVGGGPSRVGGGRRGAPRAFKMARTHRACPRWRAAARRTSRRSRCARCCPALTARSGRLPRRRTSGPARQ